MKRKLVLLLLALALCLGAAAAEDNGILGQAFPDFTVTDTLGNTFTLSEALKDHEAVLINLWATWCPPCEMELPFLNGAYEAYCDRVAFIALSNEADDTLEMIEAYRQAHVIAFPMGRDEGRVLTEYIGTDATPVTVIVDRFGKAAFCQEGSFTSLGQVARTIEAFLGDGYTESVVMEEAPGDSSTAAFPASEARVIHVENEDAKPVLFIGEDGLAPQPAYVIGDKTARLRFEIAASDDPTAITCFDYGLNTVTELTDLLDPHSGALTYDCPMPDAASGTHYTYVCLLNAVLEQDPGMYGVYLITDDAYIEELAEDMRAWGYAVRWEYADPVETTDARTRGYALYTVDQYGKAVPGVYVNFCTDTACTMLVSDDSGTIVFDGAPGVYHVQLLKAPEGYSFDPGFDMYTGDVYGEWVLRIRKD